MIREDQELAHHRSDRSHFLMVEIQNSLMSSMIDSERMKGGRGEEDK